MKITNRILSVLIVLLMLLSNGMVFAATTESYDAGYEAGYKIGYDKANSNVTARSTYRNSYKDSQKHNSIKKDIVDYNESEFEKGFIDGYDDGSDDGYDEKYDKKTDQKVDYATTLGKALGEIYGAKDFQNGESSDWKDLLPSRSKISNMYNLDKQSTAYKNTFITEFNKAFQEGYIDAYDKAMFEPDKVTLEQGVSDGEAAGLIIGAAYGAKDFYEGRDSLVYNDLPTESEIIRDYALSNDNDEYKDGFISGFLRAYEEAYNTAFREANMNNALKKVTSEVIPISGGGLVTADNRFAINIPSGIYYHDVNCLVTTTFDAGARQYGGLIKASDSYEVKIVNSSGNVDDSKLIELTFEYHGDKAQGGIYRQNGNVWLYVPTNVKEGMLTAKINPSSLSSSGTTFSAFADTNVTIFRDSRGHWAGDEIDAFVRRGIISGYGDNTFRPENSISRAEFITLLSRVYNWNTSWYMGNTTAFKDANIFGNYTDVINYSTYHGFIYGYGDGTFKPNNPITYTEVEIIMKRVLPYSYFRWANIANDMLYEKQTRSNSLNSLNYNITRAEVVYMLYNLTE